MTHLRKKPLYKNYFPIVFLIILSILLISLFIHSKLALIYSLFFIIVSVVIFLYFGRKRSRLIQSYKVKIEDVREEINLIEEDLKKKNLILRDLPSKAKKIFSIRHIAERMVRFIEPDELCGNIVNDAGNLFPRADNVLLFLFRMRKNALSLEYSFKRSAQVIKEKNGDAVDRWVLKNNKVIFIEDSAGDYRFDFQSLSACRERNIHSIISSPISIGPKLYGIMRLESRKPGAFSLEDSRVLNIICDLAAVVLEKAYLFNKIKELGIRDSLTNIFLRNYFLERFKEELERASLKNSRFGLVILDIDDFKRVNDTYGHTVGDLVLKKVASILQKNVKDSGSVVARLGGEEFVFLVVESGKDRVKNIAEDIRKKIARSTVNFRRKHINVTVSLGLAMYPEDGIDIQPLLNTADKFLYQAKREGKNKLCFS